MRPRLLPAIAFACACSDYELVEGKSDHFDTGLPRHEPEQVEEHWDLTEVWGADVLFFGDTSSSMTEELQTMGEQVTSFAEGLAAYTADWQLLAVTGPEGCGNGGVITPSNADFAATFAEGILRAPGEDLVDEWGLHNAAQAVEQTDAGECNEGFLRDDAMLSVVFISDEDDNSPGWDSGDTSYWQPYVDAVVAKKGDASAVAFSAVTGPVPDGCVGAEPGHGYADAVAATGGAFLSICDAWYEQLELLVDVSVRRELFELSDVPDPDSITVAVNIQVHEDWEYDAVQNAVRFLADPPMSGDTVTIRYRTP
jgi:hypothetical protein